MMTLASRQQFGFGIDPGYCVAEPMPSVWKHDAKLQFIQVVFEAAPPEPLLAAIVKNQPLVS